VGGSEGWRESKSKSESEREREREREREITLPNRSPESDSEVRLIFVQHFDQHILVVYGGIHCNIYIFAYNVY
jgi:hypothetical protein